MTVGAAPINISTVQDVGDEVREVGAGKTATSGTAAELMNESEATNLMQRLAQLNDLKLSPHWLVHFDAPLVDNPTNALIKRAVAHAVEVAKSAKGLVDDIHSSAVSQNAADEKGFAIDNPQLLSLLESHRKWFTQYFAFAH